MHEKRDEIRSYYNANPQKEWDRLKKKHPYEKYITIRMMDRYIKPGDRILDIGGGPGHYAIHYAKQGHSVTLLDLSDENVRFAKKNEESRIRAIEEAKRVLKPGGCLFSSFILMFGGVIYGLRELEETILMPREQPFFEVAAKDESLAFDAFTYSYMTTVRDAEQLLASVPGLRTETVFGQESILSPYKYELAKQPKKIRMAWYDYALRFCEKRDYLTHTEHLMIVSRKD